MMQRMGIGIGIPMCGGSSGIVGLAVANQTQNTGSYVVGDVVVFTATSMGATGVDLYESGVLVGAMVQGPTGTWTYTIAAITTGSKNYLARRSYGGSHKDSATVQFTVLNYLDPSQITTATCLYWGRASDCMQMGTTLTLTGTSPVITLTTSGSFVGRTEGLFVKVTTGGTIGTAKIDISIDNGASFPQAGVTTAATVAVSSTNLTLNLAAGTYVLNDTYQAVCEVFCDKISNFPNSLNNYQNLTVNTTRPFIRAASQTLLGAAAARFDAGNDFLDCTGAGVTGAFSGTDHAYCHVTLVDLRSAPTGSTIYIIHGASNTTDVDQVFIETGVYGNTPNSPAYLLERRGDTGVQLFATSNIEPSAGFKLLEVSCDGTNTRYTVNTVDVIAGDSGVSGNLVGAGAATIARCSIASRNDQAGRGLYAPIDLYEHVVYNQRPSDLEMWRLRAYFQR